MAGKEDQMKNSRVVGSGSKQAEEFKVEEVAAFMGPQPLPRTFSDRHKLGKEEKADDGWVYGGLRPCTGSHVGTIEGRKPAAAADPEGASTGAKRKGGSTSEGRKPAGVDAADKKPDQAAAGTDDDVKWVEMPPGYMAWLLAQKREDYAIHRSSYATDVCTDEDDELAEHRKLILKIQAGHEADKEEFFAFQEWVRDTFDRNGCVMIPEHVLTRNDQVIQQVWEEAGLGDD